MKVVSQTSICVEQTSGPRSALLSLSISLSLSLALFVSLFLSLLLSLKNKHLTFIYFYVRAHFHEIMVWYLSWIHIQAVNMNKNATHPRTPYYSCYDMSVLDIMSHNTWIMHDAKLEIISTVCVCVRTCACLCSCVLLSARVCAGLTVSVQHQTHAPPWDLHTLQ